MFEVQKQDVCVRFYPFPCSFIADSVCRKEITSREGEGGEGKVYNFFGGEGGDFLLFICNTGLLMIKKKKTA